MKFDPALQAYKVENVFADAITNLPVTIITYYNHDKVLITTEAYNADGTDYTGNIHTLIFPDFFLGTTNIPVNLHDAAGNDLTSTGGSLNVNITGGGGGVVGIVDQGTGGASPWLITGAVSQSGTWNIGTLTSITNPVAVTGTFWPATQPVSGTVTAVVSPNPLPVTGTVTATVPNPLPVSQSGTWNIATLTTITNPVTVTGTVAATQSGSWTIDSITNPVTVTGTVTATIVNPLPVSQSGTWNIGTLTTITNPVAATQSGTWNIGTLTTITNPVTVTGTVAATQSGTWNIGTLTTITNPVTVTGTVTATIVNPLPVSQSGTWNINNISGTISLPTGAATEATLGNVLTTSAFQARINTLGQKVMASSTPVVIASDQSAIPVSQSGTWTIGGYTYTIDAGNSSQTPLGFGATFTGTWTSTTGYSSVNVGAECDSGAITGAALVSIEFRNTNAGAALYSYGFPVGGYSSSQTASNPTEVSHPILDLFYRVKVLNGGLLQTAFYLQSVLTTAALNTVQKVDILSYTGMATENTSSTINTGVGNIIANQVTATNFNSRIGSLTETAPATDTASSGLNGRLQRIAQRLTTLIGSTLTVTGTVTANAGTNLNTSLLALESGGNLATLAGGITASVYQTNMKQINGIVPLMGNGVTGTGSQRVTIASDNTAFSVNAVQSGTWNIGTLTSITNTVTVSGTVTANAGTNLNTSLLALESGGNLATLAGGVSSSVYQANVKQINGVTVLMGNGVTGTGSQRVTIASDNTAFNIIAAGDVASGSSDSGNPIKIGGLAKNVNPTAVSTGQRVNALFDLLGKQVVVGAIRELKGVQQTSISNTTGETTIVTADASNHLDIYGLVFANTGASTTKVTIKDSTAGTTRMIFEVPTLDTRGFMVPVDSAVPQNASNNNWTATCGTATTALEVTALYVKNG